MKEFYIAPELELLCFTPTEELMSAYGSYNIYGDARSGLNTGDEMSGDVVETQPDEEMDPLD